MGNLTLFGVIAPVLSSELKRLMDLHSLTSEQAYDRVAKEAAFLSAEYYNKDRPPKVSYVDDFCRLAYLYVHVAMNANGLYKVLCKRPLMMAVLEAAAQKHERLRVCALAGGPGTELLGLAKYYDVHPPKSQMELDILFVDKCTEWQASWELLKQSAYTALGESRGRRAKWPFVVTDKYLACDITDSSQMKNARNVWDRDLYILHSFFSELFIPHKGVVEFMKVVAEQAPKGARFIFIERAEMWTERAEAVAKSAGLSLGKSMRLKEPRDKDEVPELLGEFYREMSARDRCPRMNVNFTYRIGSKL